MGAIPGARQVDGMQWLPVEAACQVVGRTKNRLRAYTRRGIIRVIKMQSEKSRIRDYYALEDCINVSKNAAAFGLREGPQKRSAVRREPRTNKQVAICPRCGRTHKWGDKIQWIGRGTPRKYCAKCLKVIENIE